MEKLKCNAWARSRGRLCQAPARENGKCKFHGGFSSGPISDFGRLRALANLKPFRGLTLEQIAARVEPVAVVNERLQRHREHIRDRRRAVRGIAHNLDRNRADLAQARVEKLRETDRAHLAELGLL